MSDGFEVSQDKLHREQVKMPLPRFFTIMGTLIGMSFGFGVWFTNFSDKFTKLIEKQDDRLTKINEKQDSMTAVIASLSGRANYEARDAKDMWDDFHKLNEYKFKIPDVLSIWRANHNR